MQVVGNGGIEQLLQQHLHGCAAIFGGQPLRGRKSTELDDLSPDREVYRLLAVHRELMDGPASACWTNQCHQSACCGRHRFDRLRDESEIRAVEAVIANVPPAGDTLEAMLR